jgi:hypothetical protein
MSLEKHIQIKGEACFILELEDYFLLLVAGGLAGLAVILTKIKNHN